jgi:hypothetical protein
MMPRRQLKRRRECNFLPTKLPQIWRSKVVGATPSLKDGYGWMGRKIDADFYFL